MPFQIRYKNDEVTGSYIGPVTLDPSPSSVSYPEYRLQKVMATVDGAVVVQRPLRDSRVRTWEWRGYGPKHPTFESLWTFLLSMEARNRMKVARHTWIEIKETETKSGGFDDWTRVRIINATRTPRTGGGPVIYDKATISFVVADSNYQWF